MYWIIVLVVFFVFLYVWYERRYQKYNKSLKNVPGPPTLPFLGNALEVHSTTEILPAMMRFKNQYGGLYKARIGPITPMIIVSEIKALELILNSTKLITKAWQYNFLHKWLGTGLLTSTGDKWRKHRKLITPAFHFRILEDFVGVFNSASDILVTKLRNEIGKDSFDLYTYISLCTLDIICESAMGTKVNAQEDSDSEYVRSVREMGRIAMERAYSVKMYDFLYKLSSDFRLEKRSLKILHDFSTSVIKKKRQQLESNCIGISDSLTDDIGRKKRLAFLDLLIQESRATDCQISDNDLREEVDTFMFEGHDTTSIAITMLLYSLSVNPDVQEKVVDEQNHIFADDQNREPTFKDLQEMKYLDLVIKETLRLYPSVPFYGREADEDTELYGHKIPKGTSIGVFAFGIHRDASIFPEPEKFIPERFEPTNRLISPFAYIPFSAGPRNCIGQKFAMLEMKLVVAKVLRNFEILTAVPFHTPVLSAESVLKSANGVHVRLKQRVVAAG